MPYVFGVTGIETINRFPFSSRTVLLYAFNASVLCQKVTKAVLYVSVGGIELVTEYGTKEGGKSEEFNQYLGSSILISVHTCMLHLSKRFKI